MKRHSASSLAVMAIMTLLAVGLVLLAAYPSSVAASRKRFDCYWDKNNDGHIFKRINCKSDKSASSLKGCQKKCQAKRECYGIEWIPDQQFWENGKECCFLMDEIGDWEFQANRVFCQ
ncbi:hypothetical protein CBR_g21270 [Chara braunii]|uniref:Apple domain-containing protein n=1 Tax=Chara braunii TaxID=69332 RepID=A0A388L148_CHABU|nr:hypothetical protein CBR_g21270 [Chara braunii]|eukprot:GBG76030.1 hypothetical protein CBR_g21270 [Chara braunii]